MYLIKKFFNHILANHPIFFFGWIIVFIVILWVFGFHFVEWRDLFHSFYFTTVTMATVGYWDMAPLTYWGKILAILYWFMGAPIFIWITWIILQSKFQKIVKWSIHEYHKELKEATKEAKKLWVDLKKEHELQEETIKKIEESSPITKKTWWKKLFRKQNT
jgi:hypothetical protein